MLFSQGCPKNKLVLGIPLYGRSFKLLTTDTGINAYAGPGRLGGWTKEAGFVSYYEVCDYLSRGARRLWTERQQSPYMVLNDQWVGYEDAESIQAKVAYMREQGLGGVMMWSLDLDDFTEGEFCGAGRFPLLNTINNFCFT